MIKTLFILTIGTILGLGMILGFGIGLNWNLSEPVAENPPVAWQEWDATMPLPTLEQIQRAVGVEPDGKIGPKTLAAWDLAVCQHYADRSNHYYEVKK